MVKVLGLNEREFNMVQETHNKTLENTVLLKGIGKELCDHEDRLREVEKYVTEETVKSKLFWGVFFTGCSGGIIFIFGLIANILG